MEEVKREIVKQLRVNERIFAKEIRLVGEKGEQLGIMPVAQARDEARKHSLDLVEVAPNSVPPVCRPEMLPFPSCSPLYFCRLCDLPLAAWVSSGDALCFPDMLVLDYREQAVQETSGEEARRLAGFQPEALTVLPYNDSLAQRDLPYLAVLHEINDSPYRFIACYAGFHKVLADFFSGLGPSHP